MNLIPIIRSQRVVGWEDPSHPQHKPLPDAVWSLPRLSVELQGTAKPKRKVRSGWSAP